MNKSLRFTLAVALAGLLLAPFAAKADLLLAANLNGTIFTCADNAACDTNPLLGQLQIADQTINGVRIVGSSQISFAGGLNFLNTSSFQIVNTLLTPSTVVLAIGDTDFIGPANGFAASGSGTFQNGIGSTITLLFYGDGTNQQGGETPTDLPGTQLATFSEVASNIADAFSFNTSGAFTSGPFFSMTLGTTGTLAAWNGITGQNPTLVGRSQTQLVPQSVPEPGTLALLALALLAVGVARTRRSRTHT